MALYRPGQPLRPSSSSDGDGHPSGYLQSIGVRSERQQLDAAFELSGSAFFTLGIRLGHDRRAELACWVFIEAATGLGLLTLLIAYLPRSTARSHAVSSPSRSSPPAPGTPPSAVELLQRYHAIKLDR